MRLDKYIAHSGIESRRQIKQFIKDGLVTVNGETVKDSGKQIDENTAVVLLNGKRVYYRQFVYLMLNKPAGYVSAREDKHYPPVTELVPEEYDYYKVYPAGRLDRNTEGLLILTNDGAFVHNLISPDKNIYKKYFARLAQPAEEADIETFRAGMEFKEFTAKRALLEICEDPREVYVSIAEGKYHQVKRMCDRVGKPVEYLKRVKIGSLELDPSLELGEVRELTAGEMELLFKQEDVFGD